MVTPSQLNSSTAQQLADIESLTPAQRLTTLLIGLFFAITKMPPGELAIKRSHGDASTLVIVQDIETAYQTIGIGSLPEGLRRPRGPDGFIPPQLTGPTTIHEEQGSSGPPRSPADNPLCFDPTHAKYNNPHYTRYMSEVMNFGPIHPSHTTRLACDSAVEAQIWDGTKTVVALGRKKRFFNRAQRRAALARDRGCQAPGCAVPAHYATSTISWHGQTAGPPISAMPSLCAHITTRKSTMKNGKSSPSTVCIISSRPHGLTRASSSCAMPTGRCETTQNL